MIYEPTLKAVQNSIKKIYDSVKIDLAKDTSPEGIAVNEAIINFYNATNSQASDLIILRDAIYLYQKGVFANLTYFKAAEKILIEVQSLVIKNKIGNTEISQNFAKDTLVGSGSVTPAYILLNEMINELNNIGNYSYENIAKALCAPIGQADNYYLVQGIAIDFSHHYMIRKYPIAGVVNDIKNINSVNITMPQDLISYLYRTISYDYLSSNPITNLLLSYIDVYQMYHNANSDYSDITNSIADEMGYLTVANATIHGISQAIANALGAGSDDLLVGMLEAEYSLNAVSPATLNQTIATCMLNIYLIIGKLPIGREEKESLYRH